MLPSLQTKTISSLLSNTRLFRVSLTWIWDLAVGKVLHEQNSKGPNIRLDGELPERDGFRRGPLDREPRALMRGVFVIDDDSREAEVRHLCHQVLPDQDVSGGQVAVNQTLALEMSHPVGDL